MAEFLKTKKGIIRWLDKMRIENYRLIVDKVYGYVIDVEGSVNLANCGLQSLPVHFNHITEDFSLNRNKLTTLAGCPKEVGGSFGCLQNSLTSLAGCPQSVGEHFNCSHNQLSSLEYGPTTVLGEYNCAENLLIDLRGASSSIQASFICRKNKLTSLKGGPQIVEGDFDCTQNLLTSLEHCPQEIYGGLLAGNNQLQHLLYFPKKVGFMPTSGNVLLHNNPLLGDIQQLHFFSDFLPHHEKRVYEAQVAAERQQLEDRLGKRNIENRDPTTHTIRFKI